MSEALATQNQEDRLIQLAQALSFASTEDGPPTLDQAARQVGVSIGELISTLNNPDFLKLVRAIMKAKAQLAFHQTVIPRLLTIAHSGSDREALTAAKIIGQLTNDLKAGVNIDIKMSFEELRQMPRPAGNPLFDLVEIRHAEQDIIDVDEEGTDE